MEPTSFAELAERLAKARDELARIKKALSSDTELERNWRAGIEQVLDTLNPMCNQMAEIQKVVGV